MSKSESILFLGSFRIILGLVKTFFSLHKEQVDFIGYKGTNWTQDHLVLYIC